MRDKVKKCRIDDLLVERGLAPTIDKARAIIMAGSVLVDDSPVTKAGEHVGHDVNIRIKGQEHPYVGRGGMKLAGAIDHFKVDLNEKICMDVGASTGGFTDCLLQKGAKKVYAIDVGYGQLAMKLQRDSRAISIERTNIRNIDHSLIEEPIDIVVIDVSFISLNLIFPAIADFMAKGAFVIALIKPQFEVERDDVGDGGIVSDPVLHKWAIQKIEKAAKLLGWNVLGVIESPIKGAKGNVEFLAFFEN